MSFTFFIVLIIIGVLQMVLGMFWYGPKMFGNFWMKLNNAEKYSQEEIKAMQKSMMPFYILQFVLSLWSAFALINLSLLVQIQPFIVAGFIWLAFIMPMIIQSVIWGSTEKKYWTKQIIVMSFYQLLASMIAAGVFYASVMWFN
jgi:hypothetical protein